MPLINLGTVLPSRSRADDAIIVFKSGEKMKLIGFEAAKLLVALRKQAPELADE
jgi:hypothetical protein